MGYTHYWSEKQKPKKIPAQAVKIIKEIVDEAYKEGIIQKDYNEKKPPIVNEKEIIFNGVGEDGHETFYYSVNERDSFHFCKTARKPYDEVVMKVLIVLAKYLPAIRVYSDGDFEEEWMGVRKYMAEKYGIRSYPENVLTVGF